MDSNKKSIDQLFKQKLENFEMSSHGASWKMLQLVKKENLRIRKMLFVKKLVFMTILLSATLLLIFSSESSYKKPIVQASCNREAQFSNFRNGNKEHYSTKGSKTSIDKINYEGIKISTLENNRNRSYQDNTDENESYFKYKSVVSLEKQLLTSISSSTYKNWSSENLETINKTSELSVNSFSDEYAPVISKDGSFMFFTSRRPVTVKEMRKGKGRERIYYTETSESGWSKPKLLEKPINSDNNFNSAVALSNDGKSLFIYRDDRYGNGDLYESRFSGTKWSSPEPLPAPINSEFHESSLSISSDGNTMYFTSNRDGGIGGMDIWFTKKNKAGIWEDAKNLSNLINTEKDEEGVFLHPDGKTLYFSSRGHQGLGGYDLFYTILENGKWSPPINMGSEINTENNDVYFVLEANGMDAYYTSVNPKSPGQTDIFKIKYNHNLHQKIANNNYTLLNGNVLTKNEEKPINATIEIYEKASNKLITTQKSDIKTGAFSVPVLLGASYRIHVFKEGFLYLTEELVIPSSGIKQVITKKILLENLHSNGQFVLKQLSKNVNSFNPANQTELDELHQLMTINPRLKIQFVIESNSNVESVVHNYQYIIDESINYLRLKGINKNRIDGVVLGNNQVKEATTKTTPLLINITSL